MPKIKWAFVLALPLLAAPCQASCFTCPPFHVDAGFSWHLRVSSGCQSGGPQAGPWYTYWPYEANFQTPAPYGYPFWPSPSSTTGVYPGQEMYGPSSLSAQPSANPPVQVKPAGYYAEPPSYWYGR